VTLTERARFDTICIHAGQMPDPSTGAIVTPIYQTSTYVQETLGVHKGYEYARTQNPTRSALEGNLAAIEHGKAAESRWHAKWAWFSSLGQRRARLPGQ
jgi:O-acetylhomoserine/O-acetylserine sulfhydrylase-like pyridoxal-dependent enzyme